jgi:hypothetical protein
MDARLAREGGGRRPAPVNMRSGAKRSGAYAEPMEGRSIPLYVRSMTASGRASVSRSWRRLRVAFLAGPACRVPGEASVSRSWPGRPSASVSSI